MNICPNICPNCGGDIEALKEMFPDGWTTCEELTKEEKMVVKRKPCPRCIKGQMSFDVYTKEDFCIQCGYRVERRR